MYIIEPPALTPPDGDTTPTAVLKIPRLCMVSQSTQLVARSAVA